MPIVMTPMDALILALSLLFGAPGPEADLSGGARAGEARPRGPAINESPRPSSPAPAPRPRTPEAKVQRELLMLVDPAQEEQLEATLRAVGAQLVGLPVRVRVLREPLLSTALPAQLSKARQALVASPVAIAAFWCSMASSDRAFLYLSAKEGDRVVLRVIDGMDASARLEAISLIVGQAVRALLAGGTIGVHSSAVSRPMPVRVVVERPRHKIPGPTRPSSRPPLPRPRETTGAAAEAPRKSRHGLAVEVAYTLEGFSRDPALSHGIWSALLYRLGPSWSLFAGFNYTVPLRAESDHAIFKLQRYPFQLGLRAGFTRGRWCLGGGLALRLEYVLHRTTSSVAYPSLDRDDLLWALLPAFTLKVFLVARLRAVVGFGALIYLNNQDYIVSGDGVREVVMAPFIVRPQLSLGLSMDIY